MADTAQAPKDKKKRKSEVKKSDLPAAKKAPAADASDAKEKAQKPDSTPGLKAVAKVEVDSVEETPKPKAKPKPILKPVATVEVESDATPKPSLKPVATVEVNDEERPKPKKILKPVATVEVDVDEPPPTVKVKPVLKPVATVDVEVDEPTPTVRVKPVLKPVATVEDVEDEVIPTLKVKPVLKPVVSVEVDEDEPTITISPRKSSYVAPRAPSRKDVGLLYDIDKEKIAELREAFHLFDLNNDGYIDKEDLRNTYITLGSDVQDDEIQHMLSELWFDFEEMIAMTAIKKEHVSEEMKYSFLTEVKAINPLDFDAFVILLGYKSVELDPEEVLLEALAQWDYDNSGLISEERIKHDLMMWGDKFTSNEVEMALEDAPMFYQQDTDVTMIDYVKFCKILCGLRKKPKMPQPGDYRH